MKRSTRCGSRVASVRTMWKYEEVEARLHSFLTSTLVEREWSPSRFNLGEITFLVTTEWESDGSQSWCGCFGDKMGDVTKLRWGM